MNDKLLNLSKKSKGNANLSKKEREMLNSQYLFSGRKKYLFSGILILMLVITN